MYTVTMTEKEALYNMKWNYRESNRIIEVWYLSQIKMRRTTEEICKGYWMADYVCGSVIYMLYDTILCKVSTLFF